MLEDPAKRRRCSHNSRALPLIRGWVRGQGIPALCVLARGAVNPFEYETSWDVEEEEEEAEEEEEEEEEE
ncbi:hypothetical protein HZH68_000073 [Vespula germanica]|nr:hypothetical protein HZH68_000073 [Vespula germanica]